MPSDPKPTGIPDVPGISFGTAGAEPDADDGDEDEADDELLDKTDPWVIAALGFDPADLPDDQPEPAVK
jgi:hypothetical protein